MAIIIAAVLVATNLFSVYAEAVESVESKESFLGLEESVHTEEETGETESKGAVKKVP